MQSVLEVIGSWRLKGHKVALATVVETWLSSPRPVGSLMGVRDDGLTVGSVSSGCVESEVVQAALNAMNDRMGRLLEFKSVTEDQLWEVGLSCGGQISVFVDPLSGLDDSLFGELVQMERDKRTFVWAMKLDPDRPGHSIVTPGGRVDGDIGVDKAALLSAVAEVQQRKSSLSTVIDGEKVFLELRRHPERLIVVGAVHIALHLVHFAKELGFETVVIEPRAQLASPERFNKEPERIFRAWPDDVLPTLSIDEDTYVVVLTHDSKIDDQALRYLLRSPARYIGALGSRTTHQARRARLLDEGFSEEEVDRIQGPVGLDIGALSPEEIALSIAAQMVQVRRGKS